MSPSADTQPKPTYFPDIALKTGKVEKWSQGITKELMTSFLTIREYWEDLFADNVDFAFGFTYDYIYSVMRVDFNMIIKYLNKYDGEASGVQEAKKEMKDANQKLYKILGTFDEKSLQPLSEKLERRAEGWKECQDLIDTAYEHLKYLEAEAVDLGLLPDPDQDANTGTVDRAASQ